MPIAKIEPSGCGVYRCYGGNYTLFIYLLVKEG